MAFPVSPTEGQTYTENNTVWIYSAVTGQWNRSVINPLNETLYVFGSASATGAAGEIQYTDGSRLAASPNLVWDDVNDELEVGGDVVLDDGGTFTTTLQTVTPTQNRTISFPNATGTVGLVSGSSGQLTYNNAGAYAGVPSSVIGATGDVTLALNGAASTPPLELTGTWFTGGTSTTTKPQILIEPAGATSTAWSTAGTGLGVNAASGFTGRLLDLQLNGTSNFSVDSTGRASVPLGTAALPSIYPGTDTNTGIYSPGADQLAAATNGSVRWAIDASGRLIGATTTTAPGVSTDGISIGGLVTGRKLDIYNSPNIHAGLGIDIGGGSYEADVYFPAGPANEGSLRFGSISHANPGVWTERMRITSDSVIAYNQPAPTSKSAAATLTIAELKTAIVQYTGSADTLTLPTGTLMEGGFSGVYTNMTFEWSVINTGSGTCTIGAGVDHTIVGHATVAAGDSGRFASRRTAANTFVSYRLS